MGQLACPHRSLSQARLPDRRSRDRQFVRIKEECPHDCETNDHIAAIRAMASRRPLAEKSVRKRRSSSPSLPSAARRPSLRSLPNDAGQSNCIGLLSEDGGYQPSRQRTEHHGLAIGDCSDSPLTDVCYASCDRFCGIRSLDYCPCNHPRRITKCLANPGPSSLVGCPVGNDSPPPSLRLLISTDEIRHAEA